MEEKLQNFYNYLVKKRNPHVKLIMKELCLEEYEVLGMIELLKQKGYLFEVIEGKVMKVKPIKEQEVYKISTDLDHIKLLLISDTHLASVYDRLDILRYLYAKAEDEEVNYILHSGDLTEGLSGRPQQIHELKETSYTGQRDYAIAKYPQSEIPTYIIAGNHDLWWVRQCGADICKDICDNRDELTYLGSDCEDLKIGKLRIRMRHGSGGSAYARSYKLQKYLDSIPADERPHILQMGHVHQAFYMKQGNTHCFQTACLQDQTPYCRTQGFSNDKSCWWVDVYMDDRGNPVKISQELESFGQKQLRRRR